MAMSRIKRGMLSYSYNSTTHTHILTSNYPLYSTKHITVAYFQPSEDYSVGDKFTINGKKYRAMTYSGSDLSDGYFTAFNVMSSIKNIIECRIDQLNGEVWMNKLSVDEITELIVSGENSTVNIVNTDYRTLVNFEFIAAPCFGTNNAIATFNLTVDNPNRLTSYLEFRIYVNDVLQPFNPKTSFGALDVKVPIHFSIPLMLNNVGTCTVDISAKTPAAEVNLAVSTSNAKLTLKGLNLYNIDE